MHVVQKAGRIGSNTTQTQWAACGAEVAVQTERALDALYSSQISSEIPLSVKLQKSFIQLQAFVRLANPLKYRFDTVWPYGDVV